MRDYEIKKWIPDLIAGLTVAGIILPESVAYAAIANLSIQHAIVATLAGLVAYACLGSSPYAIVSPTSSAAALMAAAMLALLPQNHDSFVSLGFGLVLLTGVGLLVVAKAGLGRLSAFISRPVLHGFSFALALTIIVKQLPKIFGVDIRASDPLHIVLELVHLSSSWANWSLFMGLSALIFLTLLKRWPSIPGVFIVLSLGIVLSSSIPLENYHITLVGPNPLDFPRLIIPELKMEQWIQLAELACGMIVIIVAESWGSIRSISLNQGLSVEPRRELFAIGTANVLSGLLQGMPVGAGFSASVANEQAGARSKWAGACAASVIFLTVIFAWKWIELIPEPVVAAAVINALTHALNPKALFRLFRMDRDQYLALAAVAAVLVFGVLHGMLIAVGLSLVSAIHSFSQPIVRELGELDHTRDYIDRDKHTNVIIHQSILILRPEEPLFFASIEGVLSEVQNRINQRKNIRILILSLEESSDLDSTATESFIEFATLLNKQNIIFLLARVKDPIRSLLLKWAEDQFRGKLFWSVDDAVVSAQQYLKGASSRKT